MLNGLVDVEKSPEFLRGVTNLLEGCMKANAGERLLIFREPPGQQFYCDELPIALARQAEHFGLKASLSELPVVEDVASLGDAEFAPAWDADHVVYLARCGDQLRFQEQPLMARSVICYAIDGPMMASDFAGTPHALMSAVKESVDQLLLNATRIEITCPLGTHMEGRAPSPSSATDTQIARFPLSVCQPVPASSFSGTVVIPNFLVGTGSRHFSPFATELEAPLAATIEQGRILEFNGQPADVAAAQRLYDMVATRYSIDPLVAHSWHAGIHPKLRYDMAASANYARWSGAAFGNPRILHFHTCGDYAPGEISCNEIDATVTVDGIPVWQSGRLCHEVLPEYAALAETYPEFPVLFNEPATEIGL